MGFRICTRPDRANMLRSSKARWKSLALVKDQTEEICLEAVKKYGRALEYAQEETEEMCLEAVKQDKDAVKYIRK